MVHSSIALKINISFLLFLDILINSDGATVNRDIGFIDWIKNTVISNLQTNFHLKPDFQHVDQHTGDMWLIL